MNITNIPKLQKDGQDRCDTAHAEEPKPATSPRRTAFLTPIINSRIASNGTVVSKAQYSPSVNGDLGVREDCSPSWRSASSV